MQKSQGTGAVVEDGIWNCNSVTRFASNGDLAVTAGRHQSCGGVDS
jgi:hypothetical protein